MARPKSNEKRDAILEAAIRVIAVQGLGAATATIAKEAGISNGSLFTYFETKTELLNQLYLSLKGELAATALESLPAEACLRDQLHHSWMNWSEWAASNPEKRRVVAQLGVSDLITPETHGAVIKIMSRLTEIVEQVRANGPLKNAPLAFAGALITSMAETTMDFMIQDPANAKVHCANGFEALWRAIA